MNEALVRRYFPDVDPLGKRIDFEGGERQRAWREVVGVVGVVGDVRDRALDTEPGPQIYVPFAQRPTGALALAALGLYGLLAQMAPEIGVRMALGAQRADVVRLFLGEGGRLVVAGLATGAVVALAGTRLMRGFLFGVTTADPATYLAVALLLAVVSLAACAVPAWRAARVDPLRALRSE